MASEDGPRRAALITGGSSGIGLGIARFLGRRGYDVTISARRPDKLTTAAKTLREEGIGVLDQPSNVADEADLIALAAAHRERFGRLDVLINNAGVGIAQTTDAIVTKHLDMQLSVNLRAAIILTRECSEMLRQSGAEHGKALVVNMASISGKQGWAGLSVYSATKGALIALSAAAQREVDAAGIQVTALCPGLVETPMSEAVADSDEPMIEVEDVALSIGFLLDTSKRCVVPEIVMLPHSQRTAVSLA